MDAHAGRPRDAYTGWLKDVYAYTDQPGGAHITWIKHSMQQLRVYFSFYGFIFIGWFVIANCISVSIKIDYDYNHWWYI